MHASSASTAPSSSSSKTAMYNEISSPSSNHGLGDAHRKNQVLDIALGEAIKKSAILTLGAAAATAAVAYRYKNFNRFTSLSIKVAVPSMTLLGSFSYFYETTMTDAMRHPEKWGLEEGADSGPVTRIAPHHRFLNYIYDHPFQLVAALGVPLTTAILYSQRDANHLTLSQKIMKSRVYAQGGVLVILLTTMGFREFMDRRGRFPEPGSA